MHNFHFLALADKLVYVGIRRQAKIQSMTESLTGVTKTSATISGCRPEGITHRTALFDVA